MSPIKSLGYVSVRTGDIDRWRHFAFGVLGFAQGSGPDDDALYLRMDERPARIIVTRGGTDKIETVGWEVRDHVALSEVSRILEAAGLAYKKLSLAEADARRVEEAIAFDDPAGTHLEVFHGPVLDHSPVVTPFGAKFVTGDQGLGHVVLPALGVNGLFESYTETLGFKSRGAFRVPAPPEFGPIRVRFLGVNERHRSLALCPAATLRDPGLIHLMVEVDTLDAVGQALDRVNKDGFQPSSTLGRTALLSDLSHRRPSRRQDSGFGLLCSNAHSSAVEIMHIRNMPIRYFRRISNDSGNRLVRCCQETSDRNSQRRHRSRLLVLDAIDGPGRLTLAQIVRRTGLPRSSAHQMLERVVQLRWLRRSGRDYELGMRLVEPGSLAVHQDRLHEAAIPKLHELHAVTGLVVHLAVLGGSDVVSMEKVGNRMTAAIPSRVGGRQLAHCTAVCKTTLAFADECSTVEADQPTASDHVLNLDPCATARRAGEGALPRHRLRPRGITAGLRMRCRSNRRPR